MLNGLQRNLRSPFAAIILPSTWSPIFVKNASGFCTKAGLPWKPLLIQSITSRVSFCRIAFAAATAILFRTVRKILVAVTVVEVSPVVPEIVVSWTCIAVATEFKAASTTGIPVAETVFGAVIIEKGRIKLSMSIPEIVLKNFFFIGFYW